MIENPIRDDSEPGTYTQRQLFYKIIWDIDDVCEFTSYAKGTIYNKVSSGEIPYRRGRKKKLIFIPNEVIEWLRGGKS
jgi:predicted DNA-binding transcriptional regulator AlpA